MSEGSSSAKPQKTKSNPVKRPKKRESALTPTFAAARHNKPAGGAKGGNQSSGPVQRSAGPGTGRQPAESQRPQPAPDFRRPAMGTAGEDFSRIPARTHEAPAAGGRMPGPAFRTLPAMAELKGKPPRGRGSVSSASTGRARIFATAEPVQLEEDRAQTSGRSPENPVARHLQELPGQSGFDGSVYRKEIAEFQKRTPGSKIAAGQNQLLPGKEKAEVKLRDNSQTLRRCAQGPLPQDIFHSDFTAGRDGALTGDQQEDFIDVTSAPYEAKGSVVTYEGEQSQLRQWEAGFVQTQTAGKFTAHYKGSSDKSKWGFTLPGAKRDALSGSRAPWYDSQGRNGPGVKRLSMPGASVKLRLWDQPTVPTPWETPDEKGKLEKTTGKLSFTTWLIARHKKSRAIQYLNWATWEVDAGATYNFDAKTLTPTTGKTEATGSGEGQGPGEPKLSGTTANEAVRSAIKWS